CAALPTIRLCVGLMNPHECLAIGFFCLVIARDYAALPIIRLCVGQMNPRECLARVFLPGNHQAALLYPPSGSASV
ncbi:MAG: hypothetical protein GX564_02530, partial [Oligosphaeraceae bacterium]|nr:hypothetical protein [Oligosphaeraceae bacterium]